MAGAGWDVANARAGVEAIAFEGNIPTAQFHALLCDAHGVALGLTPFGDAELQAAPNLRVVARIGVGYDTVDVAALARHKIPLMVSGTANSSSVAEQALFFMLALAKRGKVFDLMVRENRWAERLSEMPVDLSGKTLLVVGFGRIGSRIALTCLALGMTVLVYDPYVAAADITTTGCTRVDGLDAALGHADFVTIHCPRNSETEGMFDDAHIACMKSSAYLINTARGGIIDESALHSALTEGTIAGAGLDVFDQEPPQPANPLFKLPNVVTAPHIAGLTVEAFDRMAVATVQNMLDVLDGKPNMDHVVNKNVFA
jgi:D-3-phosphoglycerate dehydrogenase